MYQSDWPSFNDGFLERVSQGFLKRRKALSYQRNLHVEQGSFDGKSQSLVISVEALHNRRVILQLVGQNKGHLYVRSTRNRERGKVLLRLANLWLIDHPEKIVKAFELTVTEVGVDDTTLLSEATASVVKIWRAVSLDPI